MTHTHSPDSAWKDPIVEEVRAAREQLLADCAYDLGELVRRLRQAEQQHGRTSVHYAKRSPSTAPAQ